jgi:hypothetical protein
MISSGLATTDPMASKIHMVAEWAIMLSGTLGLADSYVDALTKEMLGSQDNDPYTIRGLLEKVHREQLASWSAGRWLAPYGMDMATFLASASTLPSSVESEAARNISFNASEYDVEIIVCGWGQTIRKLSQQGKSRPLPYIFSVD